MPASDVKSSMEPIHKRLKLFKWAGHYDDAGPDSLARQFLYADVPALIAVAEAAVVAKHEGVFEPLHDALNELLRLTEAKPR